MQQNTTVAIPLTMNALLFLTTIDLVDALQSLAVLYTYGLNEAGMR